MVSGGNTSTILVITVITLTYYRVTRLYVVIGPTIILYIVPHPPMAPPRPLKGIMKAAPVKRQRKARVRWDKSYRSKGELL